jgi:single-strand DNA-binding protein
MLNKLQLIGHVGQEPVIRSTKNGKRMAIISIATSEKYTDKSGQQQQKTEWHECIFFEALAKVVEDWVKKGAKLYVEGKIQTSKYQTEQGEDRYKTQVLGARLIMLDGAKQSTNPKSQAAPVHAPPAFQDDDIPF